MAISEDRVNRLAAFIDRVSELRQSWGVANYKELWSYPLPGDSLAPIDPISRPRGSSQLHYLTSREANVPVTKHVQRVCHHTLPWLISFSLGVWQAQSRAGVYAEASAIVYTLGQSRGVTAIAKIADGLVLLRM
jgi:hypothetical protein